jgi:hypothetical protein
MGTPTAIEVSVDDVEYSRYETGRETITATVTVSGGAPYTAEDVRVDLIKARRSRDAVVATSTISITSNVDPVLTEVTFYLPDVVDQDLIHLVRHGKYFVRATDVTTELVISDSADFDISIVSVERLKSDYLFGINLEATELKEPKFQPTQLPVTITELSKTHPLGFHVLTYNYHKDHLTDATAAIGTGANGTVTITADEDNAGDVGNLWSVEVQVPSSDGPLSVTTSGNDLIVSLGITGAAPDPLLNTATLIAAAISALADFSAVASGTGADAISAAEGPTAFLGGTSSVVRTLSWNGGTSVSITSTGTVILPRGSSSPVGKIGATSRDYICVRVRSILALPEASVAEELLIDKKTLDDNSLREYICEAISWIENDLLATPIEPTNVVTDRDPTTIQFAAGVNAPTPIFTDTDFDLFTSPLTYFVPKTQGSWIQIQTPWPQLLRVDSLFGAIANTRVIDIDLEWIEHSEQSGLVQLVPFNQEIAFDFVGLLWVNAIRGATELPNFWHYNAIVGLRDTPCEVQELIAKKAAINALIVAGMALRPGVGSVSLSRDGVSESVSYTTSAEYGVYTGTIKAYKDWITEETARLKAKYRGPTMVVV